MARQYRKKQEQLGFPELELSTEQASALADRQAALAIEVPVDRAPIPANRPAAAPDVRKPPRKRVAKPRMVLVGADTSLEPGPHGATPPGFIATDNMPPAPEMDTACPPIAANERFAASAVPPEHAPPCAGEPPAPPASAPTLVNAPASADAGRFVLWAPLAGILAAVAVVAVLAIGAVQFVETEKSQRALLAAQREALQLERDSQAAALQSRATELFLRYNELMVQVAATPARSPRRESRYWKEGLAISLLESLFNLTRGNREWENTIAWALDKHARHIREQRLPCAIYSGEFVGFLERTFASRAAALCREPANPA